MITTGKFPDAFKVAKNISIFKKGDSSHLVNYRFISLLPTISQFLKESFMTKCTNMKIILIY